MSRRSLSEYPTGPCYVDRRGAAECWDRCLQTSNVRKSKGTKIQSLGEETRHRRSTSTRPVIYELCGEYIGSSRRVAPLSDFGRPVFPRPVHDSQIQQAANKETQRNHGKNRERERERERGLYLLPCSGVLVCFVLQTLRVMTGPLQGARAPYTR